MSNGRRLSKDGSSAGRSSPSSPKEPESSNTNSVAPTLFRTKMCRNYILSRYQSCPYEDRCMFAHGLEFMRTKERNIREGLVTDAAVQHFQAMEKRQRRSSNSSAPASATDSGIGSPTSTIDTLPVPTTMPQRVPVESPTAPMAPDLGLTDTISHQHESNIVVRSHPEQSNAVGKPALDQHPRHSSGHPRKYPSHEASSTSTPTSFPLNRFAFGWAPQIPHPTTQYFPLPCSTTMHMPASDPQPMATLPLQQGPPYMSSVAPWIGGPSASPGPQPQYPMGQISHPAHPTTMVLNSSKSHDTFGPKGPPPSFSQADRNPQNAPPLPRNQFSGLPDEGSDPIVPRMGFQGGVGTNSPSPLQTSPSPSPPPYSGVEGKPPGGRIGKSPCIDTLLPGTYRHSPYGWKPDN